MADNKDSKDITPLVDVDADQDFIEGETESSAGKGDTGKDKAPPKAEATPKPKPRRSALALISFLLVILLAGAVAAGGYYLWRQQQRLMQQMQQGTQQLQQQLGGLQQQSDSLKQSLNGNTAQLGELQSNQQRIGEIAQQAISITNRSQRDWILAEVDYLIRLAGRRLEVARDIDSAAAALKAADDRIHELGDLNLLPIRKQLAKDIGKLKSIRQADVNGTALALDEMINRVGDLPFKSVQDEIKTQMLDDKSGPSTEDQPQGFVDSVISTVKEIGDIKVRHRSIEPASSAQQQLQIEQILRTHLLGARLAVLRYDQNQFIHDIQQAQQILHLHYRAQDNRVKQMLEDLNGFSSINLTPDLPGIADTWNMLQKEIVRSRLDPETAPTPKVKPPADHKTPSTEVMQ